jgi:hypothetical protein
MRGDTSGGSRDRSAPSASCTRARAQYRSVPSSNTTYTKLMPNIDCARTSMTRGSPSSPVTRG